MNSISPKDSVFPNGTFHPGIELRTELAKSFLTSLLTGTSPLGNGAEDRIRTLANIAVKSADILIEILNKKNE